MVLFLILTVPLAGLLYVRLIHPSFFSTEEVRSAFYLGIASQIIAVIPLALLHYHISVLYRPFPLFMGSWIEETLVYLLSGLLLLALFSRRVYRLPTARGRWVETLAFWTGFFLLTGLYQAVYHFPGYTPYRLFLLPILQVLMLWGFAVGGYVLFSGRGPVVKVLTLIGVTLYSALAGTVPFLFSINYDLWGYGACALLLLLTSAAAYLTETRRLPLY